MKHNFYSDIKLSHKEKWINFFSLGGSNEFPLLDFDLYSYFEDPLERNEGPVNHLHFQTHHVPQKNRSPWRATT